MSHNKKPLGLVAVGAVAALVLAACSGSATTPADSSDTTQATSADSTLTIALLGDISVPDPDTAYDGTELNLVNSAYEGLVTYEPGNPVPTLIPVLATDWSVDDTNTVYTFTLREGVTFHDGTEFTSAAIEPSFNRRVAMDRGPAYFAAGVEQVETPSDFEVIITLSAPNSAFLDYLASPFGPKIISPTALEENSADNGESFFASQDAGTGPYVYSGFTPGTSYQLTAYDDYWGDEPGYETVDFKVISNLATIQMELESGTVDGIIGYSDKTSFEGYLESDSLSAYAFDSLQSPTLFVNPDSATLGDDQTRVDFLSGVDFPALAEAAFGVTGEPTSELFPRNLIDSSLNQQVIEYDDGALEELAAGDLAGETITIGYPAVSPAAQALSENLAAVLNSAGITAESVGYAQGTYYSSLEDPATSPDLTFFTGFPDTAHPDAWARVFYTPAGGLDLFGVEVPGVTELLDEALATGDESLYGEVVELVSGSGYWYTVALAKGTAVFSNDVAGVDTSNNPVITGVLDISKLTPAG